MKQMEKKKKKNIMKMYYPIVKIKQICLKNLNSTQLYRPHAMI